MSEAPQGVQQVHTRLLKCALGVDDARAYWARAHQPVSAERAFEDYWFGAKSIARVKVLLTNFRARFDAFPESLPVLRTMTMSASTRSAICHWHLQLADPLYRAFTGTFLPERQHLLRREFTRDLVIGWVEDQGPGRWTASTRIQFASKLLSAAFSAGLLTRNRDPRTPIWPPIEDRALEYLLHLLRGVKMQGTLLDNPYLTSVGLSGNDLEERLRRLPSIKFTRQGSLVDMVWHHSSLTAWAASIAEPDAHLEGVA